MRERATDGPVEAAVKPAAGAPPGPAPLLTPRGLLWLQRRAGNRAVTALVARKTAVAEAGPPAKLAWGSTGPAVTALQMHLNTLDEVKTELEVDAKYGPITTQAVREFQAAHPPLGKTGVADAATQAAIAEALTEDQNQEDVARKLYALGTKAYERRQFGHAYAFFTRVQELVDKPAITFSRAQALRRLGGRRQETIALYEDYIARGDGARNKDAELALAELRDPEKTGDADKDRATAKAIYDKAAAYYKAGDFAHASDQFARASTLVDAPAIAFSRAQALRRLGGHRQEAIELYEDYMTRGDGARKKDAELALADLRAPAKTGDEDKDRAAAKAIYDKGVALYNTGDFAHAYDEFSRAGEIVDLAAIRFSRAQALRRLGGRELEAQALYEVYIAVGDGTRTQDAEQMLDLLQTHGAGP